MKIWIHAKIYTSFAWATSYSSRKLLPTDCYLYLLPGLLPTPQKNLSKICHTHRCMTGNKHERLEKPSFGAGKTCIKNNILNIKFVFMLGVRVRSRVRSESLHHLSRQYLKICITEKSRDQSKANDMKTEEHCGSLSLLLQTNNVLFTTTTAGKHGYETVILNHPRPITHQDLTSGTSTARRDRPERRLNGRAAHKSAMPLAVLSVYSGVSVMNGCTKSGSSKSSSSSGSGSAP